MFRNIQVETSLLKSLFTSSEEYLSSIKEQLEKAKFSDALQIINKLEAENRIEVIMASSNFITRIFKLLGYTFAITKPHVAGYFDPSTNKITILLDLYYYKNKDVFNLSEQDLFILSNTIIHEFVHYASYNNSSQFAQKFDNYWQKFYSALADIVDKEREYLLDQINYKKLYEMETRASYTIDNILSCYFKPNVKIKEAETFKPSVFYLYTFLMHLHIRENSLYNLIQHIIVETYKKAFGITEFHFWYLFYQELIIPSEIICVLSETKKYQNTIVRSCLVIV